MLHINLDWDANALAAPQGFRDGVAAAAAVLEAAIRNPITVSLRIGYGEFGLGTPYYRPLPPDYSLGGVLNAQPVSYASLRSALAAHATAPAAVQAVNALPAGASVNGRSQFYLGTALGKALGTVAADAPGIDGYAGFPVNASGNVLVSLAITEELHGMGLLNQAGDLGLVSYTSPGNHYFSDEPQPPGTSAYFSLDGGNTRLAPYFVGADETLFSGQPNDPLDFGSLGVALTALDRSELAAVGFDVAANTRTFAGYDDTRRQLLADTSHRYTGPVPGIESEYINVTADNINVSVGSDSWFIHSGSGNDALAVQGGINTLDGGTGSNFLVGSGTGTDTFFVDTRGATADTWSTAVSFHAGDAATVWGVTPSGFALNWNDNQGADGYTGLTLHATAARQPTASLTLAGYGTADLANGRLSVAYGSVGGVSYMYIHGDR